MNKVITMSVTLPCGHVYEMDATVKELPKEPEKYSGMIKTMGVRCLDMVSQEITKCVCSECQNTEHRVH